MSALRAVEVRAHAKINLILRILAREAGGYHQIETIFLRIALADIVRVRRTSSAQNSLVVSGPYADLAGPANENLASRAALAYAAESGQPSSVQIEIEKLIPVGGGLGGGSADAAAVLIGLDALSESPLGTVALMQIAAQLGADVPFLVSGHACALAWGRGGRMLGLTPPPPRELDLYVPPVRVSTRDAYGWAGSSINGSMTEAPKMLSADSLSSWSDISAHAVNDFEAPVGEHVPEIAHLLSTLRTAAPGAMTLMSGSGSTVFQVAADDGAASLHTSSVNSMSTERIRTHTLASVEPPFVIE